MEKAKRDRYSGGNMILSNNLKLALSALNAIYGYTVTIRFSNRIEMYTTDIFTSKCTVYLNYHVESVGEYSLDIYILNRIIRMMNSHSCSGRRRSKVSINIDNNLLSIAYDCCGYNIKEKVKQQTKEPLQQKYMYDAVAILDSKYFCSVVEAIYKSNCLKTKIDIGSNLVNIKASNYKCSIDYTILDIPTIGNTKVAIATSVLYNPIKVLKKFDKLTMLIDNDRSVALVAGNEDIIVEYIMAVGSYG